MNVYTVYIIADSGDNRIYENIAAPTRNFALNIVRSYDGLPRGVYTISADKTGECPDNPSDYKPINQPTGIISKKLGSYLGYLDQHSSI